MSSYGAYYYNTGKNDARGEGGPRRESPPPATRPGTAARFGARRRSITPPDGERRPPYYQEVERPRNPGSFDERNHTSYTERPTTAYHPHHAPPTAVTSIQPLPPEPVGRQPEMQRPDSPDLSEVSEVSEPEIMPNYCTVDYYTYSKCLERLVTE